MPDLGEKRLPDVGAVYTRPQVGVIARRVPNQMREFGLVVSLGLVGDLLNQAQVGVRVMDFS